MSSNNEFRPAATFASNIFRQAQQEGLNENDMLTALAIAQYASIRSIAEQHGVLVTQESLQLMLDEHAKYTSQISSELLAMNPPQFNKGVNHG